MGITVATTRVAANTSTGTQDITTTDLGGLTPGAVILILSGATSDGTAADDVQLTMGFATGASNEVSLHTNDEHGQSTTDSATHREFTSGDSPTILTVCTPGTTNIVAVAEFSTFITNGVRINWTDAAESAFLITAIFFAGTDLSAYAGSFTTNATQDAATDVTDPGFEPDLVFTLAHDESNAENRNGARFCFGATHNDGAGGIDQLSCGIWHRVSQATSTCSAYFTESYGALGWDGITNPAWAGELGSFDSSGFSCTTRLGSGGQEVAYLALAFGGVVDSYVGLYTTPTSTGNDAETGPGFIPQAVILAGTLAEASDTPYTGNRGGSIGFGAIDGDDEYFNSYSSEDGVSTTNTQSLSDNTAINLPDDDGTALLTAAFSSFDANGFTLNYSAVDAAAKYFILIAVEEESGGGTNYNFAATITAASATPNDVVQNVARSMSAALTGASATPDTPVLSVARPFAAVLTAASNTPDTAVLRAIVAMAATATAASATPDDAVIAVARLLAAVLTATTATNDAPVLNVARPMSAILTANSSSPDTAVLSVARLFAAVLTGASATPDDAVLQIVVAMSAILTGASNTPDGAALVVARNMQAVLTAVSVVNDTAVLQVARAFAATLSASSSTPDDAVLAIILAMTATLSAQSGTPDVAALNVARALSASIGAASNSNDAVVLAVARSLSAVATAQSNTSSANLLVALLMAAMITAASNTSDDADLGVGTAIEGLMHIVFSVSQPQMNFSVSQPGVTFSATKPSITFSTET